RAPEDHDDPGRGAVGGRAPWPKGGRGAADGRRGAGGGRRDRRRDRGLGRRAPRQPRADPRGARRRARGGAAAAGCLGARRVTAYRFTVNAERVELDVPGMRRLLDVLREDLALTGTKEGCGE